MCCIVCLLPVTNEPILCGRSLFPVLSLPPHSIVTIEARYGGGAKEGSDSMIVQRHDDGTTVEWRGGGMASPGRP